MTVRTAQTAKTSHRGGASALHGADTESKKDFLSGRQQGRPALNVALGNTGDFDFVPKPLTKGEILSLYQKIKSAITVRQVGEMYGMEPDRHGMVCCPFHSDSDPSMKLNDTYYYCFGCGANGDAIDLTAKLFDLNPRQAAEKLIHDFGLDPDKPPANAIALLPPKRGLTDEQWADIAYCLRVLTDYLDLLHDWRERYKPATPEEPHDARFVEALHMTETIEHLTDCVAFGTPQQKAAAAAQLLSGSYLLMLEERTDRLALAKCA